MPYNIEATEIIKAKPTDSDPPIEDPVTQGRVKVGVKSPRYWIIAIVTKNTIISLACRNYWE